MKEESSFESEFPDLRIVGKKTISDRYIPVKPINMLGAGGYGVVIKVVDNISPYNDGIQCFRALKLLKKGHSSNKKACKDFLEEINLLSKIDHPNIVRIYDWGYATCKENIRSNKTVEIPFYVMEWIEGDDLEKIIVSQKNIPGTFLVQLAKQILSALLACHEHKQRIIHLDIKPDNILVSKKNIALDPTDNSFKSVDWLEYPKFYLTDLGKAKLLECKTKSKIYETAGGGIYEYVHPLLRPFLRKNKVPNVLFEKYGEIFDLFSLGTVLKKILNNVPELSGSKKKNTYIEHLINDMRWWKSEQNDFPRLHDFKSARQVLDILQRVEKETYVSEESSVSKGFPPKQLIRLSGQMSINFPQHIAEVVDTPEFQRLRGISQLAFTSLIYPSATHSRFSHAIGAYHYANLYVSSLKMHYLFPYLYSDKDKELIMLAALLHDVGQYPYAHYLEEMMGLKFYVDHERLTEKILRGELSYETFLNSDLAASFPPQLKKKPDIKKRKLFSFLSDVLKKRNIIVDDLIMILSKKELYKSKKEPYKLFHEIVDSTFDCDKLDYLIRDGLSTGVPYAKSVDVDRFLSSLTLNTKDLPNIGLAVTAKGKSAVESIISARYNLFTEVYWHKTCRAAAAMVKEAMWTAKKNINAKEFELAAIGFDDKTFLQWIASKLNDQEVAFDLLLGSLCIYNRRSIYKRFRTFSSVWAEKKKVDMHEMFFEHLGKDYSAIIRYRNRLVKELNIKGKILSPSWKPLKRHHILLDVPTLKYDRYKEICIIYPASVKGQTHYTINQVSPLSSGILSSFQSNTKKVRLFCHPDYLEQISRLGNKVDEAIEQVWDSFH